MKFSIFLLGLAPILFSTGAMAAPSVSCDSSALGGTLFDGSASPPQMLFCLKSGGWTPAGGGWNWSSNATNVQIVTQTSANPTQVGIGSTSPQATLDVNGEIKVGNTNAACTSGMVGSQRFNSGSNCLEFCNGSAWTPIGTCGGGGAATAVCPGPAGTTRYNGSATPHCLDFCDGTSWVPMNCAPAATCPSALVGTRCLISIGVACQHIGPHGECEGGSPDVWGHYDSNCKCVPT